MPAPQFAGLNLSYLVDYRLQCPFKNEMRMARLFWEADSDNVVLSSRLTNERADGFPASIPGGRRARTVMSTTSVPVGGTWRCAWDGDGDVGISNGGTLTRATSGSFTFTRATTGDTNVNLTIFDTNPGNPVRNIWIGEDRYWATSWQDRLKPEWRDHIQAAGVRHLRFMQWQVTPESLVTHWGSGAGGTKAPHTAGEGEYFTDSDYIQGLPAQNDGHLGAGATYSSILTAAIECDAESIWLCVPHMVDEGNASLLYIDELVRFIMAFRHPYRNTAFRGGIWIEYSNETWNPNLGPAYEYCKQRGVALNLDGANDHEKGHSFYALRSQQVFDSMLASASTRGYPGQIRRVLAGQATAGEYAFRFRSQIGARAATPINVQADYWSVASYCAHTEFEPGNPTPRIRLHTANPYHTPAEWTALTDQQIEQECRADMNARVFAPINSYNDPAFPSNPTIRGGGIVADITFAGDRGMDVICYEGGTDHIVFPDHPTWATAGTRGVNWHSTLQAGTITREVLERHVDGGVAGTFVFDEGTGWVAKDGCWSWYRDHRDGYAEEPRYVQTLLHHGQGGERISVSIDDNATIVSRAVGITSSITTGDLAAVVASSSTRTLADMIVPAITTPISAGVVSATYRARADGLEVTLTTPVTILVGSAPYVARAVALHTNLAQPIPLEAWVEDTTTIARAVGIAPTLVSTVLPVEIGEARTITCGIEITPALRDTITHAVIGATITFVDGRGATPVLAGADGTATRNKFWRRNNFAVITGEVNVPHGTTVWIGQLLGWYEGLVRPWRTGDEFAGISTEFESGYEIDDQGIQVLRSSDYDVKFWARAAVWWSMDGRGITGQAVYVRNDQDFTLTPNGPAVGHLILVKRGGRSGLVFFQGTHVDGT